MNPEPPPLSGRDIKQLFLWCGRWLFPYGGFHRGPISVTVQYPADGDSVKVSPCGDITGLEAPEAVSISPRGQIPYSELVRLFLSDKERAILRAVAERGPARAKEIEDAVVRAVRRNEFYVLWSNLQIRRLIEEQDDGRFAVGWEWVRVMVEAVQAAV